MLTLVKVYDTYVQRRERHGNIVRYYNTGPQNILPAKNINFTIYVELLF